MSWSSFYIRCRAVLLLKETELRYNIMGKYLLWELY